MLSRSFGTVAEEYDRLRTGPPPEALDWLVPRGANDLLEIGAGTGTLTRLLVDRVAHITALEPDQRMRALLATRCAEVDVVGGRAEELPLPASSVDVVIAQSAWHWVDEARAIPEVARVLRPGGRLALVWTGTDRSVDWVRVVWAGGVERAEEMHIDVDSRRGRRHLVTVDAAGENPLGTPETALFRWCREMTKTDLVSLAATYSTVITMEEGHRRRHLHAMAEHLDTLEEFAGSDTVLVPMRSYCWRTTRG